MANPPQQQSVPQVPSVSASNGHQPFMVQLIPSPVIKKKFAWTGFSDKTMWDWLDLATKLASAIIIPVLIFVLTQSFSNQQDQANKAQRLNDAKIATDNRHLDLQIADNQQQEVTLRTYLDDMSNLLLSNSITPQLHQANKSDEIRKVAHAKTLFVLENLNGSRKGFVVLFLYRADLITWHNLSSAPLLNEDALPLVVLDNASLSGTDLSGYFMDNASMHNTDLSNANLSDSVLGYDDLSISDLHGAHLKNASLHGVDLHGSNLSSADLTGAALNCQPPAVNTQAIDRKLLLTCPDLEGAIFTGANLTSANFTGTTLTKEQLYAASHCKNMIMPDGQKHVQDSCTQ